MRRPDPRSKETSQYQCTRRSNTSTSVIHALRVQHILRCSPSVDHPALKTFDNILQSAVSDVTNADISDVQWLHASLPIKQGGLGVKEVHSLARPAYLASAASTLDLQTSVLTACPCATDSHFESYVPQFLAGGWWHLVNLGSSSTETVFLGQTRHHVCS